MAALERPVRDRIWWRDRTYHLCASERRTLRVVGMFRVVAVQDLRRFSYAGNEARLDTDLRSLARQHLIERHSVSDGTIPDGLAVVTLSRNGHALVARRLADPDQVFHRGVVNPREVGHDAALYRVYQAEMDRIERRGGRVRRVLLDAELKRHVYASLNRPEPDRGPFDERQHAVARAFRLVVVDGTIQFPDLRLEYETATGERARVDLELTTSHYPPSQLAAKARAGFTIYASERDAKRVAAVLEERGLSMEILSL